MITDHQQEMLSDMIEPGLSLCCGAKLVLDICMDCKEHSGPCEDFEDPAAEVARENARAAMSDNSPIELPSYADVERENMAAIRERERYDE